jgi:hypothetical protein
MSKSACKEWETPEWNCMSVFYFSHFGMSFKVQGRVFEMCSEWYSYVGKRKVAGLHMNVCSRTTWMFPAREGGEQTASVWKKVEKCIEHYSSESRGQWDAWKIWVQIGENFYEKYMKKLGVFGLNLCKSWQTEREAVLNTQIKFRLL